MTGAGRRGLALAAACAAAAAARASAADVEVGAHASLSFPFYRESLAYDPGALVPALPGLRITQSGAFTLDGRGGAGGGATVAWPSGRALALEARFDAARVRVDTAGATFDVRADLPPPLPDLATQVTVGDEASSAAWLRPLSLNLRLRTPGRAAAVLSGGLSYLPEPRIRLRQGVGLGVTGLDLLAGRVQVASVAIEARASADSGGARFGANVGIGGRLPLGERLCLQADARYFRFGRQTLRWARDPAARPSALEERILTDLLPRLPEPSFRPTFFQGTVGLLLRL
jgi:hypothetical protein